MITAAGAFAWPLGACSALATYVTIERAISLRDARTIPPSLLAALARGEIPSNSPSSAGTRMLAAWKAGSRGEGLRAVAAAETVGFQRGMFLLDSAVALAPLLGLLGTVAGLAGLFSASGLPGPDRLTEGFSLALSTTLLGLAIAIPSQLAANWLARRIEVLAARAGLVVDALERLPRP